MSKVKIEGNASGTGTLTISAPNTNTDRTLTLPDGAGEILTDASNIITAPAFSVRTNAGQLISNTTTTVCEFNTINYDTNSCYNTPTYRFTPNVAGYYYLFANNYFGSTASGTVVSVNLFKNGGRIVPHDTNSGGSARNIQCVAMEYFNGTTDYADARAYQASGGSIYIGTSNPSATQFGGFLVRKA